MRARSKGRMLRQSISKSKNFASLSEKSQVVFVLLVPHYSPYGKMNGSPFFIKGEVMPLIDWATVEVIEKCLKEIDAKTNVKWFEKEGVWYIHALDFDVHQDIEDTKKGSDSLPDHPDFILNGPPVGPTPTINLRKFIYLRDKFTCLYCGEVMSYESRLICLDHVIPIEQGGTNSERNLITACKKCSGKKYGKTPEEAGLELIGYGEKAGHYVRPVENKPEPPQEPSEGPPDPVVLEFPVRAGKDTVFKVWPLKTSKLKEYEATYPGMDVFQHCKRARQWTIDNPSRQKTFKGYPKFLGGWLDRDFDSGKHLRRSSLQPPRPVGGSEGDKYGDGKF